MLEVWSSHGVPGEIRQHKWIVDAVSTTVRLGSARQPESNPIGRSTISHLEITRSEMGRMNE